MKVLSIRQPWAYLIAEGAKDIENRTWATNYRGPVLIHAGKTPARQDELVKLLHKELRAGGIDPTKFDRGGIVGMATITDCVDDSDSEWFFGPYGFVLTNPRPLPFYPMDGRLGLFDPSPDLAKWVREQLRKDGK